MSVVIMLRKHESHKKLVEMETECQTTVVEENPQVNNNNWIRKI